MVKRASTIDNLYPSARPLQEQLRSWHGKSGQIRLKARLTKATYEHAYIRTTDDEDIMLPVASLDVDEKEYARNLVQTAASESDTDTATESTVESPNARERSDKREHESRASTAASFASHPDYSSERCKDRRDTRPPSWRYRRSGDIGPQLKQRHDIRDDTLPKAAAARKTDRVRELLYKGYNIEAVGPESYEYTTTDSEVGTTTHRVNFPETTALFRAAAAGQIETAHLLLRRDADVRVTDKNACNVLRKVVETGVHARMVR